MERPCRDAHKLRWWRRRVPVILFGTVLLSVGIGLFVDRVWQPFPDELFWHRMESVTSVQTRPEDIAVVSSPTWFLSSSLGP
jgi:hypothetical protein